MFSHVNMETSAKAAWERLESIHRWHDHKVASLADLGPIDKEGRITNASSCV